MKVHRASGEAEKRVTSLSYNQGGRRVGDWENFEQTMG